MKSIIDNKKLIQKKRSNFRCFELIDDGVLFESKINGNYSKYKIPFDDIDFNEIINNKTPYRIDVFFLLSVLLNFSLFLFILMNEKEKNAISPQLLSGIMFGMIGGISVWAAIVFKKESLLFLEGRQNLSFYYSKDDQVIVNKYIDLIKEAKKKEFRQKNLKIDDYIPTEIQKSNFLWMYRNDQITKEEYEDLITQLDNLRIIRGD